MPNQLRVLIVGNGAREHAIAWKLAQSPTQPVLFAAPGNPGICEVCECVEISVSDMDGLVKFVQEQRIDFVVIGPELPLSLGLADRCEAMGVPAFGPNQRAAELESSKAFAKFIMQRAGVPTADFHTFTSADEAKMFVRDHGAPIVVKADGLAAGKGVVVAETVDQAVDAIDDMMVNEKFGQSGNQVVIESFLQGPEVSLMFFVDGDTYVPMVSARDYKRVGDADAGPNTGGMGAFAPVPAFVEANAANLVADRVVKPTLAALREEGITYRGVLYVGLMMTANGPYVIEFNARFGDPETEVVLPLLESDLLEVMWAVAHGKLAETTVAWKAGAAVCVVLTSAGYPEKPQLGQSIEIKETPQGTLFHAGTAHHDGNLVTAGGRVITASAVAATIDEARAVAYEMADAIYFEGKHTRRDIALFRRDE